MGKNVAVLIMNNKNNAFIMYTFKKQNDSQQKTVKLAL